MTDPKDNHQAHYTTTPPDDRVGSLDRSDTPEVVPPEGAGLPAHTDKGVVPAVTRDPQAMERQLQAADYAGSNEPEPEGNALEDLGALGPGGVGLGGSGLGQVLRPVRDPLSDVNRNPGYVPPSQDGPREVGLRPADMPEGAPGEASIDRSLNVEGDDRRGEQEP